MARIGWDFGGVISQDIFRDDFLDRPAVAGAVELVAQCVARYGADNMFIVSKARSEKIRSRTVQWLQHTQFWEQTGMLPGHLIFCDSRADKSGIAADLELDAFVDDTLDVFDGMTTVRVRILFAPSERDLRLLGDRNDVMVAPNHGVTEIILSQTLGA